MREKPIIFVSILKWSILAIGIGVLIGTFTAFFLKVLDLGIEARNGIPYYFLLLPVAFLLSSWIVTWVSSDSESQGTGEVIEAIHKKSGKIKPLSVPLNLFAILVTIISGGSAGKESPCAEIGAGVSSFFSDLFKFNNEDRKKLVICGISAGFASAFGTPMAGAIFGVEVLFIGVILYDVLLPSIIAGIVSYHVAAAWGTVYMEDVITNLPSFSGLFFLQVIFAGIFFGLCSWILISILALGKRMSRKFGNSIITKSLVGSVALIILTLIFSTQYLGLGISSIDSYLAGQPSNWYDFLLKIVFTTITLNFGGSGGLVTPIFFIGSSAGALFASLFNLNIAVFAAIGMVALLAGATNTPIAASILAIELFGPEIGPYAALACVVSFLMTGNISVYPSQILSIKKSSSLKVETGKEISKVSPLQAGEKEINFEKKISDFLDNLVDKLWKPAPKEIPKEIIKD